MAKASRVDDPIATLADRVGDLASAVLPPNSSPAPCPSGRGHVMSLTEAGLSITAGLMAIAESISDLANAVREAKDGPT